MASRSCSFRPPGAVPMDAEVLSHLTDFLSSPDQPLLHHRGLAAQVQHSVATNTPLPIMLTAERICFFIDDLQYFMEQHFGRSKVDDYDFSADNAVDDSNGGGTNDDDNNVGHLSKRIKTETTTTASFLKLSAAFFRGPFDATSPLLGIIEVYIEFQIKHGLHDLQLSDPNNLHHSLQLIYAIYERLEQLAIIKYPVFYLCWVPFEKRARLKKMIELRRGSWVDDEQKQVEASHIVVCLPEEDYDSNSDGNSNGGIISGAVMYEYKERGLKRNLRHRAADDTTLVHWRFYPSSYDEWISATSDSYITTTSSHQSAYKQWVVSSRFIRDCVSFNEWGDEVDYEVQAKVDPLAGAMQSQSSLMNSSSNSSSNSSGNANSDSNNNSSSNNNNSTSNSSSSNSNSSSKKRKSDGLVIPGMPDTSNVVLVKPPTWFSTDSVSLLEMRYLPDIFSSSSRLTTGAYIKLRNQIVSMYEQSPLIFLSGTDVRRKLSGDSGLLMKVRDFLDSFGVINQNVKLECRPPISTSYMKNMNDFLGHYFHSPLEAVNSSENKSIRFFSFNPSIWTSSMDITLMDSFLKHGGDWLKISASVSATSVAVTKEDCIVRFVTLPISPRFGLVAHADADQPRCLDVERDLQNRFIVKALELFNREDFVSFLISNCQKASVVASDPAAAHTASIVSSLVTLQDTAAASLAQERKLLDGMFRDYMEIRTDIFEKRVATLSRCEALQEAERSRFDVERRDILIHRAHLSQLGPDPNAPAAFTDINSNNNANNTNMNMNFGGANSNNILKISL